MKTELGDSVKNHLKKRLDDSLHIELRNLLRNQLQNQPKNQLLKFLNKDRPWMNLELWNNLICEFSR
jgi:hypothetical protein